MFISIIVAAILTCFIETLIITRLLKQYKLKSLISNTIIINLITNLTLNITTICLIFLDVNFEIRNYFIVIAELTIPIVEYFMFRYCYPQISKIKLLTTSGIANILSFSIGLLIF